MSTVRLSDLQDTAELAKAVGVAEERILSYVQSAKQIDFYGVIRIPKRHRRRKNEFRVVHKVKEDWLAQLHRMIAILVGRQLQYPDYVQGFVDHRSILTNARQHLAPRIILHGDIAGFFDAITTDHVHRGFVTLGCSEAMAQTLARATTIDGFLRQGTRCAPAMANLVCRPLDVDLHTLGQGVGAVYTRYADDLTFSGDEIPTSAQVESVVKHYGFELRDGRCHSQKRGRGQFVTGLTVSDSLRPRLPRRLKRQLRLVLYYIEKYGATAHFERAGWSKPWLGELWLEGMLNFARSIEPQFAPTLREKFRTKTAAKQPDPS